MARSDDTNNYGIIEAIAIEHDAENGDFMMISGRFLQSLLARRIVFPTAYSTKITGENCPQLSTLAKTYGNMVKYVLLGRFVHSWILAGNTGAGSIVSGVVGTKGGAITENVNTRNGRRMIPGLWAQDRYSTVWSARIGTLSGDDVSDDNTTSGTMQVTGKNVMDWIYKVCEMVGGTIQIDASNLMANLHTSYTTFSYMTLILTEGEDLRDRVIFSDTLDSIASMSYSENFTDYTSFAYAFGSGEGEARKFAASHPAKNAATGFDRRVLFVSATNGDETDGEVASSCDLMEVGLEALTSPTYAAEAEIVADGGQYTYGTDYKVGDIVSIRYEQWGLSLATRLTGMIESFDQSGRTLTPTFSFLEG